MNKKMKKVVTLVVSGVIMVSSFVPVFADEKKVDTEEYPTFKEYIQEVKDIKKDDLKSLKSFYNEAISFEKQEKFTEADKKWDAFDGILEKYEDINLDEEAFESISFKTFMEGLDVKIKKEDMKKLEKLYNEAIALEKNEKSTNADKIWDQFDTLLDKYFDQGKFEDLSFDDFYKDFKDLKIKKEDVNKLKELYKKAISLEKSENLTEAEKCWDGLYTILDTYLPAETCDTTDEK